MSNNSEVRRGGVPAIPPHHHLMKTDGESSGATENIPSKPSDVVLIARRRPNKTTRGEKKAFWMT